MMITIVGNKMSILNIFNKKRTFLNYLNTTKKKIIVVLGSKGGIGKTCTAIGIAKNKECPYFTNDKGSIFASGKKLYKNYYDMENFKEDSLLKESEYVVIDFKGTGIDTLDKEELYFVKMAHLVIIPTGEDKIIEHSSSIRTALSAIKLNKKIIFISTKSPNSRVKKNCNDFIETKAPLTLLSSIHVLPLSYAPDVIIEAIKKDCKYEELLDRVDPQEKINYKHFVDDWKEILTYIK